MTGATLEALVRLEGILGDVLAGDFRTRIPPLVDRHYDRRVRMLVMAAEGKAAAPTALGQPPELLWKASGALHGVLRQFRLDFLRHLGPAELQRGVCLTIDFEIDPLPVIPPRPTAGASAFAPAPDPPNGRLLQAAPGASRPAEAPTAGPPQSAPFSRHTAQLGQFVSSLPGNFYQDYFGFERMPFNNTPDTHFFYPTQKHQEALSRLIYAISERKGFAMISGEIGSGKSTLCRALLAQLPREVKTALITQTHLDALQLVRAISEDLGLDTGGLSHFEILEQLNRFLIQQLAADCTVCILIDEAQNLSPAALEEIRMISNLETEQEKLVQLILLGQPDLRDKIDLPELRQLRQRISVRFHLEPLSRAETRGYIRHRLQVAKPQIVPLFSRRALAEVHNYSGGVPRLINSLCDNALLTAFTRQARYVTAGIIREAGHDLDLERQCGGLAEFFKFW